MLMFTKGTGTVVSEKVSFQFIVLPAFYSFLYARLKNGRIMLYPSASVRLSVRLSVRPSVNFFVSM